MKIIGITGSIGSGKTTIANTISSLGYVVWNIDVWVRRLYHKKDFIEKIKSVFPHVFEKDKLNKVKLREFVFNNKQELNKLESIIHPIIKQKLKQKIRNFVKKTDFVFMEQALLFEMGWDKYCSTIILANVDYEIAKKRVIQRDGISIDQFEKISQIQTKNIDKISQVDIVINTDMSLNLLKVNIIKILEEL